MAKGEMVSTDYMIGLMEEKMNSVKQKVFLIDGFPRT